MVELIEICKKCGSKRGLWTPDAKAPIALRQAAPIRVIEPPLDKRIAGIPMHKEFCKDCEKWLGEKNG